MSPLLSNTTFDISFLFIISSILVANISKPKFFLNGSDFRLIGKKLPNMVTFKIYAEMIKFNNSPELKENRKNLDLLEVI